MQNLHDSWNAIGVPACVSIKSFAQEYRAWSRGGLPGYDCFDFLECTELADWLAVVYFPPSDHQRYSVENVQIRYEGVQREMLFQSGGDTGKFKNYDQYYLDRWRSIHKECVRVEGPVFAESKVEGIDRDFIEFEIGLFPFKADDNAISHIVSLIEVLR